LQYSNNILIADIKDRNYFKLSEEFQCLIFNGIMSAKDYIDIQVKFGERLQKIRLEKGFSLRALAANCDIDDSKISKIENGKFNIKLSTIIELAKGLGVESKDLLDFK
jgi:DNA-binding Xre family transcriptional regulator